MSQPPDEPQPPPPRPQSRVKVLLFRALGLFFVALATVGAFLPVMPTTIFLILAVWAFANGSPELADRLRAHPRFGPTLVSWEERRAIPRPAKAMAVGMMGVSWTLLFLASHNALVLGGVGALLLAVAGYVVSRPSA